VELFTTIMSVLPNGHDRNKMDSSVALLPQNDTIRRFCHSEQSEESIRQQPHNEATEISLIR
jgi:hypothetical protein